MLARRELPDFLKQEQLGSRYTLKHAGCLRAYGGGGVALRRESPLRLNGVEGLLDLGCLSV